MTTLAKLEANRTNGQLSNGPKTANGKAVAKMNAVTHGLRSLSPVIPGEQTKDWNPHRAGIVAALAPVGTLEAELAERVALVMWRLRRVVRYETAVSTTGIDNAVARARGEEDEDNPRSATLASRSFTSRTYATVCRELEAARANVASCEETRDQLRRLPDLPPGQPVDGGDAFSLLLQVTGYTPDADREVTDIEDHEFLAEIGVPEDWRHDPDWWDGWTAEIVRAGVKVIAEDSNMADAELLDRAIRETDRTAGLGRRKALKLEAELARLTDEAADAERVASGRSLLPSAEVVDKVVRYESHLNRQLTQTLHQLERWQAIRSGRPPAPPAALDVTVESCGVSVDPAG